MSDDDVTRRFAGIIADNFTDTQRFPSVDATRVVGRALGYQTGTGPRDWPASDEVQALEDAETHFTPPRPSGVLASTDPVRRAAAIGAVALPLLAVVGLIFAPLLGRPPVWLGWAGGVAFAACLAMLLWRMPSEPQDRDDDGARVS